jgi:hypothetical protein
MADKQDLPNPSWFSRLHLMKPIVIFSTDGTLIVSPSGQHLQNPYLCRRNPNPKRSFRAS